MTPSVSYGNIVNSLLCRTAVETVRIKIYTPRLSTCRKSEHRSAFSVLSQVNGEGRGMFRFTATVTPKNYGLH